MDAEQIAAGLTKAQREALLQMNTGDHWADELMVSDSRLAMQLYRKGLLYVMPSGIADDVWTILQAKKPTDER
jgi:hypothetical protein